MITSLLYRKCEIWNRIATGTDGNWYGARSADDFDLKESDVPCLFLESKGMETITDEAGNSTVVDGRIRMDTEIVSTDRIVLGDYNYTILSVQKKIDAITERVLYYVALVSRRRQHAETVSVNIR